MTDHPRQKNFNRCRGSVQEGIFSAENEFFKFSEMKSGNIAAAILLPGGKS